MTERERYITDFFKKWEGFFGTDGADCGGTMMGVTLCTYRFYYGKEKTVEDLKKITDEQWFRIFKDGFYDKVKGEKILNQSVCLLIVDWCWMSGVRTAVKKVQDLIGVKADGIVGPRTLAALNADAEGNFKKIWSARRYFYRRLVEKNPGKKKYYKGWLNRLNDIKYSD